MTAGGSGSPQVQWEHKFSNDLVPKQILTATNSLHILYKIQGNLDPALKGIDILTVEPTVGIEGELTLQSDINFPGFFILML